MRGAFLDIQKAFEVWHSGRLFTLEAYGVEDELLAFLKKYLDNREQRAVLNGQKPDWRKIKLWSTTRVSVRISFTFNFQK